MKNIGIAIVCLENIHYLYTTTKKPIITPNRNDMAKIIHKFYNQNDSLLLPPIFGRTYSSHSPGACCKQYSRQTRHQRNRVNLQGWRNQQLSPSYASKGSGICLPLQCIFRPSDGKALAHNLRKYIERNMGNNNYKKLTVGASGTYMECNMAA